MQPVHAHAIAHDELMLDGNARMNLATFTTTWLEPEARSLMDECVEKNIVDKDEYPRVAELEARCVHMLADLWGAPDSANTIGTSTTGSSEAAMLAGLAAQRRWRARRKADGALAVTPNLVCGPVQVCWEKFARYFDVELREVPMTGDEVLMTPADAVARCDENTIAVVASFGQTFTGRYEDVAQISAALDDLQERTGLDVAIHVDAATGGFLAPFAQPDLVWDFRLPRVRSINASGHKTGLVPLGCGWVVWRDAADLPAELVFNVNYLGGEHPTFSLNFSRPGGQVAVQYYMFLRLGREGYEKVQRECYAGAQLIARGIEQLGPFQILFGGDSRSGIPAVAWRIAPGTEPGYTLFDVADRLRTRGWLVPAYTLPPDREDLPIQRAVIRHGFSRDMADLLLADIAQAVETLKRHPVSVPLTQHEAGGFGHDGRPVIATPSSAASRP